MPHDAQTTFCQVLTDNSVLKNACSQESVETIAWEAFRALYASSLGGESALAQCPIEAVLLYSPHAAIRLQQMLEAELTRWVSLPTLHSRKTQNSILKGSHDLKFDLAAINPQQTAIMSVC